MLLALSGARSFAEDVGSRWVYQARLVEPPMPNVNPDADAARQVEHLRMAGVGTTYTKENLKAAKIAALARTVQIERQGQVVVEKAGPRTYYQDFAPLLGTKESVVCKEVYDGAVTVRSRGKGTSVEIWPGDSRIGLRTLGDKYFLADIQPANATLIQSKKTLEGRQDVYRLAVDATHWERLTLNFTNGNAKASSGRSDLVLDKEELLLAKYEWQRRGESSKGIIRRFGKQKRLAAIWDLTLTSRDTVPPVELSLGTVLKPRNHVSDFRLANGAQTNYRWTGKLPELAELQQINDSSKPRSTGIAKTSFSSVTMVSGGLLLFGLYLLFKPRRLASSSSAQNS
ncbi:MAG: hypothetical protein QOJ65_807 [Fimbriimonadaceae bacterium]|nr:hypothetical protein [Fimbriimonadaceae bacterium]